MLSKQFQAGGIDIPSHDAHSKWLLVALHGSEGSAENFRGLDQELGIPSLNYLYLNGPIRSFSNYRWYNQSPEEAFSYLEDVFSTLERAGYPPEKTFLLGFSQGAALTFEFGARYPQELAGYIAISGRIENLPALLSEVRPRGDYLVTHGLKDYNLSPDITRSQVQQLKKAGFVIDYQEYDKIHAFDSSRELPYIRDWIRSRLTQYL